MNGLTGLKDEVVRLIGAPCMVQRDRTGRALFFSDYGRRGIQEASERLAGAGFTVQAENGMAHIGLTKEKGEAFLLSLPAPALPPMNQENALAISTLLMLGRHAAGSGPPRPDALHRALRSWDSGKRDELALLLQAELSLALREHAPAPALLARLLYDLISSGKEPSHADHIPWTLGVPCRDR